MIEWPKLDELRGMAAAGEIEALFVYSFDRLADDQSELLVLLKEFGDRGVQVHFVQEQMDLTPEGALVQSMLEHISRWERARREEKSRRGKRAAVLAGRIPEGAANRLYGYDYDPRLRHRVVLEREAIEVLRVFRLYAEGWSMSKIARTFNDEGVPSKMGGRWCATTIRRILTNLSYIGVDYYGKVRAVRDERGVRKNVKLPREEWIEIKGYTPALVPEALFWTVNERLDASKR